MLECLLQVVFRVDQQLQERLPELGDMIVANAQEALNRTFFKLIKAWVADNETAKAFFEKLSGLDFLIQRMRTAVSSESGRRAAAGSLLQLEKTDIMIDSEDEDKETQLDRNLLAFVGEKCGLELRKQLQLPGGLARKDSELLADAMRSMPKLRKQ